MNCSKCNAPLPGDAAFCPECGAPVEAPVFSAPSGRVFCPNCGTEAAPGSAFCGYCGTKIGAPVPAKAKPARRKSKPRGSKPFPVKKLLFALVFLAAAVGIVVLAAGLLGGKSGDNIVYVKNEQLQLGKLSDMDEVLELTSDLLAGSYTGADTASGLSLDGYVQFSENGKRLFYPDRISCDEYGYVEEFTLYYRPLSGRNQDAVKIDSSVTNYVVNPEGTLVSYLKNGKLYQSDLTERVRIASDVESIILSEDGQSLLYITVNENEDEADTCDIYVKRGSADPEKLLSSVYDMHFLSEDFTYFVYEKNDSLYTLRHGEEPVKIASDISSILMALETGEIYYTRCEQEDLTYWDVIDDDKNDEDYTEYYSERLSEYTMSYPLRTLYYFDGEESHILTENFLTWHSVYKLRTEEDPDFYSYPSSYSGMFVFEAYDQEELPKIKLSEYLESDYSVYSLFNDAIEQDTAVSVALNGTTTEVDAGTLCYGTFYSDGKVLYITSDYDDEADNYALYQVDVADGSVGGCELLDDEVENHRMTTSGIVYIKDTNEDQQGDLYLNGKFIDDDVNFSWSMIAGNESGSRLYYLKDYSTKTGVGSLMYYDGKETSTVKDDVHSFTLASDDQVLFLYDYNKQNRRSELWILDGRNARKLDEDVLQLVYVD